MSVILNALKRSEEEAKVEPQQVSRPFQDSDGFFKGKQSFVVKDKLLNLRKLLQVDLRSKTFLGVVGGFALVVIVLLIWILSSGTELPLPMPAELVTTSAPNATAPQTSPTGEPQPAADTTAAQAKALQAFSAGNYDESINILKEATASDPNNAKLHNALGLSYMKKELYASANDEYKRALELDDKCAECFNNFGYLKSLLGEAVESKKYLEKAIAIDPAYPDPYFNMAVLYEKTGDYYNAVTYYKKFSELYPDKESDIVLKVQKRINELSRD